jgi:hypothetical protein
MPEYEFAVCNILKIATFNFFPQAPSTADRSTKYYIIFTFKSSMTIKKLGKFIPSFHQLYLITFYFASAQKILY